MGRSALLSFVLLWAAPLATVPTLASPPGGVFDGCADNEGPFGLPGPDSPPELIGAWSPPATWPVEGTHLSLLHTGKVLMWREGNYFGQPSISYLWDPSTGEIEPLQVPSTELFCSGFVTLPDGRLLAGGGSTNANAGIVDTNIFDPATSSWTRVADMHTGRWYGALTLLTDDRVLASGGHSGTFGPLPEIYDVSADTWTELPAPGTPNAAYAWNYLKPDGNVAFTGPTRDTQTLDLDLGQWVLDLPFAEHNAIVGSSLLYRPGKVIKVGGIAIDNAEDGEMGTDVELLDLNQPSPAWLPGVEPRWARGWQSMTLLADGQVLVGGGATGSGWYAECAIHTPEIWNPDTQVWTEVAAHQRPRMYHSSMLLLPDGRVLFAGSENVLGQETNYEIYSPPYLFRGPRPHVNAHPSAIGYGDTFRIHVPNAGAIASVALVRPGTTTHQYEMSGRYVPLAFSHLGGASLSIVAPPGPAVAPRGYYMLIVVNDHGVPSVGEFLRMGDCTATQTAEASCGDFADNDCDGLSDLADLDCGPAPLPFAPAGFVPDGQAVRGAQLTVALLDDGRTRLDWGPSCDGGDVDYAVYEGQIGDYTSHVPVFCSTGGATTRTFARADDRYYLIVPHNGTREGGYGYTSSGERVPSAQACLPQESSSCN